MKPFVALYKCWRGGEFLRASLDSIAAAVDGVVAVFPEKPWIEGPWPENCRRPLREFARDNPKIFVAECPTALNGQEDLYAFGLQKIRDYYFNAAVMIVDSDEIWEAGHARKLKAAVEQASYAEQKQVFTADMLTYVRSPLYQVWPPEPHCPVVALASAHTYEIKCRFMRNGPRVHLPNLRFHHYSYVRADDSEIAWKLRATESQEIAPSHTDWMERVWPEIPAVQNFHMTRGHEQCWHALRVIDEADMPPGVRGLPLARDIIQREERRRAAVS